jgi:uncharacterized membrane protein
MNFLNSIQQVFEVVVKYGILFLEATGVAVLLVAAGKSLVGVFKNNPHVKLDLAEGISLALGFKLGGEVLRTVIARTWDELAVLGAIVVLRAAITVLIQWEIKNEEKRLDIEGRLK